MASPTTNRALTWDVHGGGTNAWDTPLNADFENIDLGFGGNYPITITATAATATYNSSGAIISSTVATVTLPSTLAQNMRYNFTGTITRNVQIVFPASQGRFVQIVNGSSGSFTLQAITATGGSSGPLITQGKRMWLTSEGTNMYQADTNQVAAVYTQLGTPISNVAGNAATTSGGVTDIVWDATNKIQYTTITTGSTATTVWRPTAPNYPMPMGYLTPTTGVPVIVSDVTATSLFYTPFKGNWVAVSDGTATYGMQFSQLTLSLSAVGANNVYDVFIHNSSGTLVIGHGPSWTVGGGSITAGSGARGSGAGSTALSYLNGLLTNTVSMTLTSGGTTYSIGAAVGVYLGSIYTSSAGTVTCTRTFGQNRVWGVYNAYNRQPTFLKAGPSTGWTYGSTNYRVANNSTGNSMTVFSGQAESVYDFRLQENIGQLTADWAQVGIGYNSTNTASGFQGAMELESSNNDYGSLTASFTTIPSLGINVVYPLERSATGGTAFASGPAGSVGETMMVLSGYWAA